ncbi:uncharacterized protein LOC135146685 isoform X4 [Zophobas morio]|uniref:uncharacterized protein LOC135146685 isoform X4 n=1 Tax=Zophobas morio TaxID=2755281 RepID=UPI003082E562
MHSGITLEQYYNSQEGRSSLHFAARFPKNELKYNRQLSRLICSKCFPCEDELLTHFAVELLSTQQILVLLSGVPPLSEHAKAFTVEAGLPYTPRREGEAVEQRGADLCLLHRQSLRKGKFRHESKLSTLKLPTWKQILFEEKFLFRVDNILESVLNIEVYEWTIYQKALVIGSVVLVMDHLNTDSVEWDERSEEKIHTVIPPLLAACSGENSDVYLKIKLRVQNNTRRSQPLHCKWNRDRPARLPLQLILDKSFLVSPSFMHCQYFYASTAGLSYFRTFLASIKKTNYLELWRSILHFQNRQISRVDISILYREAFQIYTEYLCPCAPCPVSLPRDLLCTIEERLYALPADWKAQGIFDVAEKYVLAEMEGTFLPLFYDSNYYRTWSATENSQQTTYEDHNGSANIWSNTGNPCNRDNINDHDTTRSKEIMDSKAAKNGESGAAAVVKKTADTINKSSLPWSPLLLAPSGKSAVLTPDPVGAAVALLKEQELHLLEHLDPEVTRGCKEKKVKGLKKKWADLQAQLANLQAMGIMDGNDERLLLLNATIVDCLVEGLQNKDYGNVIYIIEIIPRSACFTSGWVITRSYSSFRQLRQALAVQFPKVKKIELPPCIKPKFLLKLTTFAPEEWLEKKQRHLRCMNSFLQIIISDEVLFLTTIFQSFIGPKTSQEKERQVLEMERIREFISNEVQRVRATVRCRAMGELLPISAGSPMALYAIKNKSARKNASGGGNGPAEKCTPTVKDKKPLKNESELLKLVFSLLAEFLELGNNKRWLHRNFWNMLQEVFQQTYGVSLSKQLAVYMQSTFSEDNIALWLDSLLERFWPNDSRSPPTPPNEDDALELKPRVKEALFAALPELLVSFMGSKTCTTGCDMVVELLHNQKINKHLYYVCLDALVRLLLLEDDEEERVEV